GLPVSDAARALEILSKRSLLEPSRTDVLLAPHSLLLKQGQSERAGDVTDLIEDASPEMHAHTRLRVLDALYSDGDPTTAASAAAELESALSVPRKAPAVQQAGALADMCVLGQWHIARGDTALVPAIISRLK